MLQQTQVKTVIPFYHRWMAALPTIELLAKASPERLHKLWEGLGYYSRVRNMQRAAQIILSQHGGFFPREFNEVLALPGIGRYTAGAICSIAFNQATPILDGNVLRVLTRLLGILEDPRRADINQKLWQVSQMLVETAFESSSKAELSCSILNQALMELGALLCTPNQPSCTDCPVALHCHAFREGKTGVIPKKIQRCPATRLRHVALILQDRNRFLVRQRPEGGVNSQFWEFPSLEIPTGCQEPGRLLPANVGFSPEKLDLFCTIKHSITRYRITVEAYFAKTSQLIRSSHFGGRWVTLAQLQKLALTAAHRKIANRLELVREPRRQKLNSNIPGRAAPIAAPKKVVPVSDRTM